MIAPAQAQKGPHKGQAPDKERHNQSDIADKIMLWIALRDAARHICAHCGRQMADIANHVV